MFRSVLCKKSFRIFSDMLFIIMIIAIGTGLIYGSYLLIVLNMSLS